MVFVVTTSNKILPVDAMAGDVVLNNEGGTDTVEFKKDYWDLNKAFVPTTNKLEGTRAQHLGASPVRELNKRGNIKQLIRTRDKFDYIKL